VDPGFDVVLTPPCDVVVVSCGGGDPAPPLPPPLLPPAFDFGGFVPAIATLVMPGAVQAMAVAAALTWAARRTKTRRETAVSASVAAWTSSVISSRSRAAVDQLGARDRPGRALRDQHPPPGHRRVGRVRIGVARAADVAGQAERHDEAA